MNLQQIPGGFEKLGAKRERKNEEGIVGYGRWALLWLEKSHYPSQIVY
jgi:hypothetical protein